MADTVRRIQASPEAVFAVLADGWLYPCWVVGASRMRSVDASWPAVDARLHHSFGVWPVLINDQTQMLEWEPPRRARLQARGWPMGEAEVEIVAESTPDGCEVRIRENPTDGPATLVPEAVRDPIIGIRNVETLKRLAFLAEGNAGA